jgi:hypothetical protein
VWYATQNQPSSLTVLVSVSKGTGKRGKCFENSVPGKIMETEKLPNITENS